MDHTVIVTNIQRFSLHDGPGIRTTVFLKGCSLHCPWCSNPENVNGSLEMYRDNSGVHYYGKEMTLSYIFQECIKDRLYYVNGGGVTFSGGEPLLYVSRLEPLLKMLKHEDISLCAETALFVNPESVELAALYFDYFCVDIKILDKGLCDSVLGGNIDMYMNNVSYLIKSGRKIQFRMPLIPLFTMKRENVDSVVNFCVINGIRDIELIKGHNLAEKKYLTLGREMYVIPDIEENEYFSVEEAFARNNINAKICKI